MRRPVTQIVRRTRAKAPWVPAGLLRALVTVRNVAVETTNRFNADRGLDLSGSLAFTTLLAAVPLLATLSLVLATFFQENVAAILDVIYRILPYHAARVTESLQEFVAESTTISALGILVLGFSSVRLIFIVEAVVNAVWGAPRRRGWLRRIAIYTFGLLALALLVGTLGLWVRALRRLAVGELILGSGTAQSLFPIAVEFIALVLIYRLLPNAYVRWSAAAIAAGVISVLFEVLRRLFGFYVATLSSMNLITGSLTLVLFSLLSLFFVWALILLGVELTHVLQTRTGTRRRAPGPGAGRAENAIRMVLRLSKGGLHRFRDLYHEQEADSVEAERLLDCLRENGLVAGDDTRGYSLARPAGEITVAAIVEAVSPNLYALTQREDDHVAEKLEPLFLHIESERRSVLGTTIADLEKK